MTERLDSAGIAFMLTGSMAMNYYAQPRMTRDIDIVVEVSRNHADALAALFAPTFYVDADMIREAVDRTTMFNIVDNESIVKVDFVIRKSDAFRQEEFARRRRVHIDGFETWIVSREDLILSKLVWAAAGSSERQLRDVRNLMNADLDRSYLAQWATRLGVGALLDTVTHG